MVEAPAGKKWLLVPVDWSAYPEEWMEETQEALNEPKVFTPLKLVKEEPQAQDETRPEHLMDPAMLRIGDTIAESPVGPGTITDITDAGFPRVNNVAVAFVKRTDGVLWERAFGHYKAWKDKVHDGSII